MNKSETIAPDARLISNKRSAACELEGEIVILNLDSGVYFGLNAVGATIWEYLQSEHSAGEIVDRLLVEYHVDRERCESEVYALLRSLAAHGLIDISVNEKAA
ncbi:MAG TPA: PqqD family protein [Bryobacteraceae bacterium]|jgi:hypothetical protein